MAETVQLPSTSSEESVAIAANTLDQLKSFSLATLLESLDTERAEYAAERERLLRKKNPNQDLITAIAAQSDALQAVYPATIDRFEQSLASRVPAPAEAAIIRGRVFVQTTRIGIAGATVVATNAQGATMARTVTNEDGVFELSLNEKAIEAVVLDVKSGRTSLFTDAKPAALTLGTVTYREIAVNDQECPPKSDPPKSRKASGKTS